MNHPVFLSPEDVETTCPYCGVGCGMTVSSKTPSTESDSFEVKVKGSPSHRANYGKLCVKGSSAGETVDFSGRMLHPQIDGNIVDWKTALNDVAKTFQKTISEYGADSVAFYVSGQFLTEDYYVANKLIKGFMGTANIDTNSRLCMASAVVGYKRSFGSDTVPCCYEDLEHADLVTLVGSNTAWAHPIVYQRIVAAKKENPKLKIVVVDPRKTATCDIADLHLAIKPGMDAALFNGLLAYLNQQNALDLDYIQKHTEGFESALQKADELQGNVSDLATQCDLNETDLQQWLDWATSTPKMMTMYSQGINQSSSGVDKSNAIINCHLATGRIGKEGMGPFSITGQPNAMGGREVGGLANQLAAHMDFSDPENIDRVARFWQAENMAQQNGLKAVDLFQAVGEGKIKAIWIMNTNPVVSMPDADNVKRALEKCDYVVVQDCMQDTDTTRVANVLLPATTWGETDGAVTNSDRTISIQRQFMQGPENARPDWWILSEVAKRMGWEHAFNYDSAVDIFREHAQLSGFENNGSRDFDISAFSNITKQEYADFKPIQWPVNASAPNGTQRIFSEGRFFTPSKKAQFIAITPYAPLSQQTEDKPYVLNTGRVRDQWHTMTRTAKTAKLMAHKNEPYITLHPDDASPHQLLEGDLVRVSNELGQLIGRVEISGSQRRGDIFVPIHWTSQYASHGRVDSLVRAHVDPLSGQPESKHTTVKIERYSAQWQGFILSRTEINPELFDDDYWIKITGKHFYRYEIASERALKNAQAWAKTVLSSPGNTEWIEYDDASCQQYRAALIKNDQLQKVFFMTADHKMPSRDWLGQLFSATELSSAERRSLLAGKASGAKDPGRTICSCFGIGINTIIEAIESQNLVSVEAIGQALKAGTNCGSCVPELTEILAVELSSDVSEKTG